MADKNLYANDLIHRESSWTFSETTIGGKTRVEFKDGATVKHQAFQPDIIDAYRIVRDDYLNAENPIFLSTTTERDALTVDAGTTIYNITTAEDETYDGTKWVAAGGETGGIIHKPTATVQTTDNTETTVQSMVLEDNSTCLMTVEVIGETADHSSVAGFILEVTVFRTGGGNATLAGAVTIAHSGKSGGATSWSATFTVSGNDIRVSVTGANATTINWKSSLSFIQF